MAALHLTLFGYPQIEVDLKQIVLHRHKALALCAYLAMIGHPQRRSHLSGLFWPQMDQDHARSCLRRTLLSLRRHLGPRWLAETRETVSLTPGAEISVDVWEFRHALEKANGASSLADPALRVASMARAIDLYVARFMDGFTLKDAPDFDEWQYFEAEKLHLALETALDRLIRELVQIEDLSGASVYAHRWLSMDQTQEKAHQYLMQLFAVQGNRVAALRQYALCCEILEKCLSVPPSPETTWLFEQIRDGRLAPPASAFLLFDSQAYADVSSP